MEWSEPTGGNTNLEQPLPVFVPRSKPPERAYSGFFAKMRNDTSRTAFTGVQRKKWAEIAPKPDTKKEMVKDKKEGR